MSGMCTKRRHSTECHHFPFVGTLFVSLGLWAVLFMLLPLYAIACVVIGLAFAMLYLLLDSVVGQTFRVLSVPDEPRRHLLS